MQIVSACCALNCSSLQYFLISERAKWTLQRHTSAAAAAKLVEHSCVRVFRLFCFPLLFERFKVAEIDFLRTRIAELENASAAGDEPMQTDDDDVVILEALPPPATAAVSNAAAAKKVRCSTQIFVLASRIHLFVEISM